MYCIYCGNAREPDAEFCHCCGRPFDTALPAAPAGPPPSAPPDAHAARAQRGPAAPGLAGKLPLLLGVLALSAGILAGVGLRRAVQTAPDAAATEASAAFANVQVAPAEAPSFTPSAALSKDGGLLCSGVSASGCDRIDVYALLVSTAEADVTLRSARPVQTLHELAAGKTVAFSLAPPGSGDIFEVWTGAYASHDGDIFAVGSLLPFATLSAQGLEDYQTRYAFFQDEVRLAVLNADGSRSD